VPQNLKQNKQEDHMTLSATKTEAKSHKLTAPLPGQHPGYGVTLSKTIIKLPRRERGVGRVFEWPQLFANSCTLGGNQLIIFDDGTAEWRASVMSQNDGDDSWGCRFLFLDDHNVPLWQHGWIWSPTLSPTPIDWVSLNQIFFAAYIFPSVTQVSMEYHC
jgi:hypothetical protein